jgi:hypothetical protein
MTRSAIALLTVGFFLAGVVTAAQQPRKATELPAFTPEREAAALRFVEVHHPEFAGILRTLQGMDEAKYRETVREIFQRSETLAELAERDLAQHEVALAEWKNRSRLALAAARVQRQTNDALLAELRQLLGEQIDLKIRRKRMERDRAAAQVTKAEEAIAKLSSEREQTVEQQLRRFARAGEKSKGKTKPTTKPAAKPNAADAGAKKS